MVHNTKKKTTEEFKKELQEKYGDKYDYSKVEYVNSHTKVCIICPKHGEFWATPTNLLTKGICTKCTKENKNKIDFLKKQFISKSRLKYGDKYDYSKVEYVNSHTKVCIICPKHGEFWISPTHFLSGQECILCTKEQRLLNECKLDYNIIKVTNENVTLVCDKHGEFTISLQKFKTKKYSCPLCNLSNQYFDFIEKAKQIHGDKYEYDKNTFINYHTKMRIICPKHGEFWQTPYNHLKGQNCKQCMNKSKTKTQQQFIEDLKKTHGDKYDYSKIEYINSNTKVCLICPKHGEFWATPNQLLSGKGCPKCSKYRNRYTTDTIINAFKQVHGDKYVYTKVNYINMKTKVCLICPIHGEFWITPNKHLMGCGCSKCKQSHLEYIVYTYLNDKGYIFSVNNRQILNGLELDFYIEELKIGIECQGTQHFFPKTFYGSKNIQKESEALVKRDVIKNKLCRQLGIRLFYIMPKKVVLTDIMNNPIYSNIYTNSNIIIENELNNMEFF